MLKNRIKKTFLGQYLISELHALECFFVPKIIPDKAFVKHYYKRYSGNELNLYSPKSFSEKINWYKLNNKNPLMAICADKVDVRSYVSEKGYDYTLNHIIAIFDDVNELKVEDLPERFVIKAAHGSHMNLIVKDNKSEINWKQQKALMKSWLHQDIYWSGREWVYRNLKKRIIVEDYLEDETGELRDYKFFCFNGEPQFVQVEVGRFGENHARNFYDMNWSLMPFGKEIPCNPNIQIQCPYTFPQMQKMAKDLSKPFDFVRVDLYQVKDEVKFGELTFFPAGGKPDFVPAEYDQIVGKMWKITIREF